ncbi:MAG: phosphate signaling complex protein PhoU [Thermoplasmata archaeon]
MEKYKNEMLKMNRDLEMLMENVKNIMDITLNALVNLDLSEIEKIREMDISIYHMVKDIETKCINIILMYSPIARDLRRIITVLKIISDIDRIGRYSYDISLSINKFVEKGHLGKPVIIPKMVEQTKKMVEISIKSFIEENLYLAESLQKEDNIVDELFKNLEYEILDYMKKDNENLERGINYMLIGKYLERMADHAVNIGDNVIYMLTGKRIIKL